MPLPGRHARLAGLVACGRCRNRMTLRYQRGAGGKLSPVYVCSREKTDYGGGQCQQLAGSCLDGHVTGLLLDALAPAALEVSLAAAGQVEARRAGGPDLAAAPGTRRVRR